MTDFPKNLSVSVVIPCFNSGITLERTIDSIISQSYLNIEIIIVDDASSDPNTIQKISYYESSPNIKVFRHGKNRGLPAARNTGFLNSTGDLVMFLDADDWLSIGAIEAAVRQIPFGDKNYFLYFDIIFENSYKLFTIREYKPFSQLAINQFPYSIIIRKDSVTWTPLYDESYRLGLEDWDLNLTLIELGFQPIRIPGPYFHYFESKAGMFKNITQKQFFTIYKIIKKNHPKLFSLRNLMYLFTLEFKHKQSLKLYVASTLIIVSFLPFNRALDFFYLFLIKLLRI